MKFTLSLNPEKVTWKWASSMNDEEERSGGPSIFRWIFFPSVCLCDSGTGDFSLFHREISKRLPRHGEGG